MNEPREWAGDVIPAMTDPLGKHWRQPHRAEILVDGEIAVMTEVTLKGLSDYSCTTPTGVYAGKMWRRRVDYYDESKGWLLVWYGAVVKKDGVEGCPVYTRRVSLIDEAPTRR